MKNQVVNRRGRWWYSTNGGQDWTRLSADNPDDSSEAIDEASEETGIGTAEWDLVEE